MLEDLLQEHAGAYQEDIAVVGISRHYFDGIAMRGTALVHLKECLANDYHWMTKAPHQLRSAIMKVMNMC
jgi:hypothetical protein